MIRLDPLPARFGLITAFRSWLATRLAPGLPTPHGGRTSSRGQVTLLGAGPGAADLITLRGMQALQTADVVFYDRLADPALLTHVRPDAVCQSVGKSPGAHSLPQIQINERLIAAARRGHRVVRLKCGDPGIFGRGAEEAAALTEAGIDWTVIPGVTAACAAAAASRSFLTERGVTERVVFATGHRREGDVTDWSACATPGTTLACYMGVSGVSDMQAALLGAGWPAVCPVEVISRAQTDRQRLLRGRLADLPSLCAKHGDLAPAILIIRWPVGQTKVTQSAQSATFDQT